MDKLEGFINNLNLNEFIDKLGLNRLPAFFENSGIKGLIESFSVIELAIFLIAVGLILRLARIAISELIDWAILGLVLFVILHFANII